MLCITVLSLAATFVSVVQGRPTPALDADALQKNRQKAEEMNYSYETLSVHGSCITGEVACIDGDLAQCVEGQWKITRCPRSLSCIAQPSKKQEGVVNVGCAASSEHDGGIIIISSNGSGEVKNKGDDKYQGSYNPKNKNKDSDKYEDHQKTVTVTLAQTIVESTTTLSPEQASSVLSSVLRHAITIHNAPEYTSTAYASVTTTSSTSCTTSSSEATSSSTYESSSSYTNEEYSASTSASTSSSSSSSASATTTSSASSEASETASASGSGAIISISLTRIPASAASSVIASALSSKATQLS